MGTSMESETNTMRTERPYVRSCTFCGDGLLRMFQCLNCQSVSVICDECELLWSSPQLAAADPPVKADGNYPACKTCSTQYAPWQVMTAQDIQQAELDSFVAGDSV